ncbi:hypothetical protein DFS33DRAFT_1265761, partial [Desarmillaria ectypa]
DLFALVIGIDNYTERRSLTASVLDAQVIVTFLKSIGVPEQNIIRLYDLAATFDGILKGFDALVTREDIKKDRSSIFIYFSEHGTSNYKSVLHNSQERYWSGWDEQIIERIRPQDIG